MHFPSPISQQPTAKPNPWKRKEVVVVLSLRFMNPYIFIYYVVCLLSLWLWLCDTIIVCMELASQPDGRIPLETRTRPISHTFPSSRFPSLSLSLKQIPYIAPRSRKAYQTQWSRSMKPTLTTGTGMGTNRMGDERNVFGLRSPYVHYSSVSVVCVVTYLCTLRNTTTTITRIRIP